MLPDDPIVIHQMYRPPAHVLPFEYRLCGKLSALRYA